MLNDIKLTQEEKEKMEKIEKDTVESYAAIGHRRYVVIH